MMKRFVLVMLTMALVAGLSSAAEPPKGDLGKLQGKWKGMAGLEKNIPVTFQIKDGEITISVQSPDGQDLKYKGKVKLDETASPKTLDFFDFSSTDGDALPDSKTLYEISGEDTLKICTSKPGDGRPKEFKEDKDNEVSILTMTKVKE